MTFEVYPRIAPRSPSTMLVDSPSPISRLADQFQRENLGAHGSPEMPGRLPLVDMLDTQLSFYTAAAASSPPGGRCQDEDASPALRSIVQQAQKMRLESARCPSAFRSWQASQPLPTPSPRPGVCNPKRKLWAPSPSSPAGDLHGYSGRRCLMSATSLPAKRHCAMVDAVDSKTAASQRDCYVSVHSSISAPEPMQHGSDTYASHAFCRPWPPPAVDQRTHFGTGQSGLFSFVQAHSAVSRQSDAIPLHHLSYGQAKRSASIAAGSSAVPGPGSVVEPMLTSPLPSSLTGVPVRGLPSAATPGTWSSYWESPLPTAPLQQCTQLPSKRRSLSPLEIGLPSILPQAHDEATGLPSILPETLAALVRGQCQGTRRATPTRLLLLDCRNAYEHVGGCISQALNVQSPSEVLDLTVGATCAAMDWHHTAVVFYCEFSSMRAPRLFRAVRNADRKRHLDSYPELQVPHMYMLKGGYHAFHSVFPDLCTPQGGYVRMAERRFSQEIKRCLTAGVAMSDGQAEHERDSLC